MKIIEINDKKKWDSFMEEQPFTQFLQSWQWGEFHEKMGRKVWRLALIVDKDDSRDATSCVSTDGGIIMAAQIIKYALPLGQSYLYAPRGPIWEKSQITNYKFQKEALELLFEKTKMLAAQEKSIFFKIEPREKVEDLEEFEIEKTKSVQPAHEWLIDLGKSEDDLLKEMQQKTRYNIRLAEKKSLEVKRLDNFEEIQTGGESLKEKFFESFWLLISLTYGRKEIKTHTREYYKNILDIKESVKLWTVADEEKIICANLLSYFGDTVTYMHGGADYRFRDLMAPYAMQWECIKHARKSGYKYYNFGGITGINEKNSGWAGITRFKKGFGGFVLDYAGTYDIPLKKIWYKTYRTIKSLRG